MRRHRLPASVSLAIGACFAFHQPAKAASDADIAARQAEIIQQRQQQQLLQDREDAQRAIAPGGVNLKAIQPTVPAGSQTGKCHDISRILIENSPKLGQPTRQTIDTRFAGQCLGSKQISEILGLITKDYIDHGYISARAYLPSQDLSSGSLHIVVVEGRIEAIKIEDGDKHSVSVNNTFPFLQGKTLNLRDLEQGIDQINRLQSNDAKLDIQPGSVPGDSVVLVRNSPTRPIHLFATYDNQGAVSTGANEGSATVTLDSLAGFNELFSYTHRESLPDNNGDHFSLADDFNLSLPLGYHTFSVDVNRSKYNNVLTLPSGTHETATGSNKTATFGWNQVVYRDHDSRFSVGASLTTKDARNYFADQYLTVSSRKLSVLDLKTSWSTTVGRSYLNADLDYARGLAEFGAMHDSGILPGDQPHAQFQKMTLDFRLHVPLELGSQHFSYDGEIFSQQAFSTLYGSEQVMIGGLYSVRGFVNNTLSGDNGYYWRNDLSWQHPFVIGTETFNGKVYVALDTGWVSNRNADLQGGRLTGAAAGLQVQWRGLSWDLFRSTPIAFPESMTREPAQTWFRVSASL